MSTSHSSAYDRPVQRRSYGGTLGEHWGNTVPPKIVGVFIYYCNDVKKSPVLLKLLQLSLTFGVGSAGCERSFSSLGRIKTKLRSTMGEERLTNIALLSIERELSGGLDLETVIVRFSGVDEGRSLRLK